MYVTGSDGAALFPFANDSSGLAYNLPGRELGGHSPHYVGGQFGQWGRDGRHRHREQYPHRFRPRPGRGNDNRHGAFSPGDTLVGLAADPINPNIVFVAGTGALFLVNVNSMSAQQLYALPASEPGYFLSLVVTTDATTALRRRRP